LSARRDDGFTLLELILSLAMLAIMVVIVFGTFRVGVRAWEKGERDIEVRHRQRIVLEQMRRQLVSMSTRHLVNDGNEPFFPIGSPQRLQFISEVPLLPGNDFGLVYVEYRVEPDQDDGMVLKVFERNLVFLEASFLEQEPDEDAFVELLPGLTEAAFSYRSRPEEGQEGTWQEEWLPDDEMMFPRAVRFSYAAGDAYPAATVIAAIEWEEGR
jgi:general secretion pathway protein J